MGVGPETSPEQLPTEADINVYDSLDERVAVRNFLGKSVAEIEQAFVEGFGGRLQEDLMWMGPRGFAYYVAAYTNYLKSDRCADDSGAASSFVSIMEFRMDHEPNDGAPWSVLIEAVDHVLQNYDKYGLLPQIYGDLRPRYEALRERLLLKASSE